MNGQPMNIPVTESTRAFEFGEPESALDRTMIFDMFQVVRGGQWFEPPISQLGLGKAYRMASHHQAALTFKRNMLVASMVPNPIFPRAEFAKWALDYLVFGKAYLEMVKSMTGRPLQLLRCPAAWTRVGCGASGFEEVGYWYVQPGTLVFNPIPFAWDQMHHLIEPDPLQEIYGMPEYLSALQSGLLNENATLFRRRYYLNGMHAGFILYISEENFREEDSAAIREQMRRSKGLGNFKNLFLHVPKGKKDGVQILPISEIAAKDEFLHIKEVTRDDMLSAHRVPPQLLGIVPKNGTGFGNVVDAARAFYQLEIVPLQHRLMELNEWLGFDALSFSEPKGIMGLAPATPSVKG